MHDLHTLRRSLIEDFGIVEPRIAVMALNPHAGDGGLLGHEEQEIIRPAIVEAFRQGVLAFGPFAATGCSPGADTPSTTASWPCTTTRGWRPSRRSRPTA